MTYALIALVLMAAGLAAALAGATFTGAVSGIAPTANAHFATKKYVDDAIAALDDLSGVSF